MCILTERNEGSMKKCNCWEYKQNMMMSAPTDRPKRTPGLSDVVKHGFLKLPEDIRLDKIDNAVHLKKLCQPKYLTCCYDSGSGKNQRLQKNTRFNDAKLRLHY